MIRAAGTTRSTFFASIAVSAEREPAITQFNATPLRRRLQFGPSAGKSRGVPGLKRCVVLRVTTGRRANMRRYDDRLYHGPICVGPGASRLLNDVRTAAAAELDEALDALLGFGASMLRAGATAVRTHECMDVM